MSQQDSTWTSLFDITSVKDTRYTFRVKATDTFGNENDEFVQNVGIDDELPYSNVLPLPEFMTETTKFNVSWEGGDNESGLDCYVIQYRYNDTESLTDWTNLSIGGETCTSETTTEFDAEQVTGTNPNKYKFYFRSLARDNAGNQEPERPADTQTTIFIPLLTNVYAWDRMTGLIIPSEGKTSSDRVIDIIATNRTPVVGRLNFTLTYYNHSPGSDPLTGGITSDTRNNVYSINLSAGPYGKKTQVSYWAWAEKGTETERSPPTGYWYFTMYDHPLSNFVVKGNIYLPVGRSELVGVEVRNIQSSFDRVYLELDSEYARFIETGNQTIIVELNPQEEKTLHVRLYPSGLEGYNLNLNARSLFADPALTDFDTIRVIIFMPEEFSGLDWLGVCLLLFLAVLIYLKFVRIEN